MTAILVKCPTCGTKNRVVATKQHLPVRCGRCKGRIDIKDSAIPVELGDKTLDTFIHSVHLPILVDFFSPACGPCITLAPLLNEMAKTYLGRIIITKVDTTKNPGCAAHYRVKGVPTLIFFKDGKVLEEIVGLPEKNYLRQKLDYYAL
jgi:thioredoxin 2